MLQTSGGSDGKDMSAEKPLNLIPANRLRPPFVQVRPPVRSRLQALPFHELTWVMFEALCLRLAIAETHVDECIPYGQPGETQHGIDLFGWRQKQRPVVYQCKRHSGQSFRPSLIGKEVARFLGGRWGDRAGLFVFCCIAPLNTIKRANAVDDARERLKDHGVDFEPWDATRLSRMLKDQPAVVDDFFGRDWVRAFNGEETATSLGERLTGQDLIEARSILCDEARMRTIHGDAYGPTADSELPPFVAQRVLVQESAAGPVGPNETVGDDTETAPRRAPSRQSDSGSTGHMREEDADTWIARNPLCHLIGEVGQGKSTLLRRIELDLLADGGRFPGVASRNVHRLPVLVSFPSWVVAYREKLASPEEIIEKLVSARGSRAALPAVRSALRERTVFLLVDGLDETADTPVANDVLRSIGTWARRDIPVIVAGRSSAQVSPGSRWKQATLGPMDEGQQLVLAEYLSGSVESSEAFLRGLAQRPEVARLAGVPLFFRFLFREWRGGREMPVTRSEVVAGLVREALVAQPSRRSTLGGRASDPPFHLDLAEVRGLLAGFARQLQEGRRHSLDSDATTRWWRGASDELKRGVGLQESTAAVAHDLLTWCLGVTGILWRSDSGDVGFRHRAIQERLVAEAISADKGRLDLIAAHGADPWWSGVWPHVVAAVQDRDHAGEVVGALEATRAATPEAFHLDLVLLDCAIELLHVDESRSGKIAASMANVVESQIEAPHRQRLVERLAGLARADCPSSSPTDRWFPGKLEFTRDVFLTMASWPSELPTVHILLAGLQRGETGSRLAALSSFCQHAVRRGEYWAELDDYARAPNDCLGQAIAWLGLWGESGPGEIDDGVVRAAWSSQAFRSGKSSRRDAWFVLATPMMRSAMA